MTLVDKSVDGNKHVWVDWIAHLVNFVAISISDVLWVTFRATYAHLSQILQSLRLFLFKYPHVALVLGLGFMA